MVLIQQMKRFQGAHRHIEQKYGKYGNFDSLNMGGIWEVLAKFPYKIWEIWEDFFTTLQTFSYKSANFSTMTLLREIAQLSR